MRTVRTMPARRTLLTFQDVRLGGRSTRGGRTGPPTVLKEGCEAAVHEKCVEMGMLCDFPVVCRRANWIMYLQIVDVLNCLRDKPLYFQFSFQKYPSDLVACSSVGMAWALFYDENPDPSQWCNALIGMPPTSTSFLLIFHQTSRNKCFRGE